MRCLLYINLVFCNSLYHSLFSNTVYTIINQSSHFIKQQRAINKVTTHRGAPRRFVTSWFKSQKDLIKSWINPGGKRCCIDSIDGNKAAYFFSLVSVNMLGKRNKVSSMRKKIRFPWWGQDNMQWPLCHVSSLSINMVLFILLTVTLSTLLVHGLS